jgi:hypothetical protein
MATFPYVTDVVNAVFGTHLHQPIPMFGTIVAIAGVVVTSVANNEVANRWRTH